MTSRGHELVDVSGRLLIETEAGDKGLSRVTSALGGNGDQEGKETQYCECSELQRAVHEVDGVEPGPEGSCRGDPHPIDCVGALLQQPSLLIQQPSLLSTKGLSPRGACPRWIWRKR